MIARQPVLLPAYADEVLQGLRSRPKHLPCKLFYDERGSELFEQITSLPEYYLTRTELSILQANAPDIVQAAGPPVSLVELGAGTAAKTGTLLRALARRQMRVKYFPVDISPSALSEAQRRVRAEFAGALVKPVVVDFADGFGFLRQIAGKKFVLYLGSSIGNFDWNAATAMLRQVREQLASGDALLLGTDMVKAADVLVPAYDDPQGVTAEFNKNILRRLNRDFKADFDLQFFDHVAEWSPSQSRMEIYLESTRDQTVHMALAGTRVRFAAGERIHTENSHKYTLDRVASLLCVSGFRLEQSWFDELKWFGLHLARV
jgi:L-histidine Nalpha-methyltransferase